MMEIPPVGTPLLQCWKCEANDEKTCFKSENMNLETCNENTLQCVYFKHQDTNGNIYVKR